MKTSRVFAALLAMAMLLSMLAGCGADSQPTTTANNCEHMWYSATCDAPKTCSICGKVEGTKLPHQWTDADCDTPKRCYLCNATEGEALGHQWSEGDCETAKVCTVCNKAEGEAPGHDWAPATIDAPKTCKVCGKTEGEKIYVDPRFKTENCQPLFGTWVCLYENDFTAQGLPGLVATMKLTMEFRNDGTMTSSAVVEDPVAFEEALVNCLMEMVYEQFAATGMTKEQIDEAFLQGYGMTIEEFCRQNAGDSVDSLSSSIEKVYYVEDGLLYGGEDWDSEMTADEFVLEDGKLSMYDEALGEVVFTLVETEE